MKIKKSPKETLIFENLKRNRKQMQQTAVKSVTGQWKSWYVWLSVSQKITLSPQLVLSCVVYVESKLGSTGMLVAAKIPLSHLPFHLDIAQMPK